MQGAIDLSCETPIPIKQAPATIPIPGRDGQPVHWMTVGHWCRRGLHGVVLESVIVGNQRCVTREAYFRFVERVTTAASANGQPQEGRPIATRTRRQTAAAVKKGIAEFDAKVGKRGARRAAR
jgi:hypothetical protein